MPCLRRAGRSTLERMCDRLTPAPEPPLKMIPSSRYQLRIESIVSSTERMKHAARLLRHAWHADVEPHRAVERRPLRDEDVLQLGGERRGLRVVGEIAALATPPGDRVGDPVDDLAQRRLPLGGAERAAEVLLGDDVAWRSATTRRGTRRRSARRRPIPSTQFVIRASRRSHTTSSYGSTPGDVNSRPRPMRAPSASTTSPATRDSGTEEVMAGCVPFARQVLLLANYVIVVRPSLGSHAVRLHPSL